MQSDEVATPSVSALIMAYNEVTGLEPVVREACAVLLRCAPAWEVVIIDDGSTDGTGELADRLAGALPGVRAVHHAPNQGLGAVYQTGFREARRECVIFLPADGEISPAVIERFLPRMAEADLVLGYLPDRPAPLLAKALSAAERLLFRVLFGTFPRFQGALMFRRALLESIDLRTQGGRGWTVLMELILKADRGGHRWVNEPTELRPRLGGQSKVRNARTVLANLQQVLVLRRTLGRAAR